VLGYGSYEPEELVSRELLCSCGSHRSTCRCELELSSKRYYTYAEPASEAPLNVLLRSSGVRCSNGGCCDMTS